MPPPMLETCDLCGRKFGKASLLIHMKACVAKREASTAFCPVCDNLVSNDEYEKHVAECKVVNAAMLKQKKAAAAKAKASVTRAGGADAAAAGTDVAQLGATSRSKIPEHVLRKMQEASEPPEARLLRRIGSPCDACGSAIAVVACIGCHAVYCVPCSDGIHSANKALADHNPTVREDLARAAAAAAARGPVETRSPCNVCKRMFAADRIAKHQLICTKLATKKPRKAFLSAEEERLRGTEFEKFRREHGAAPKKPAPVAAAKAAAPSPSKWRQQHAEMQAVLSAVVSGAVAGALASTITPDASGGVDGGAAAIPAVASRPGTAPRPAAATDAGEPVAAVKSPEQPVKPKKPTYRIGDKLVVIDKGVVGVLQFKGPIWGMKKGTWYGVEFHDGPFGDSNGSFESVQYFYCPDNHGMFVRPDNVRAYVDGEVVVPGQVPTPAPAPAPAPTAAPVTHDASATDAAAAGDDGTIVIKVGGRRTAAKPAAVVEAATAPRPPSAQRPASGVSAAVARLVSARVEPAASTTTGSARVASTAVAAAVMRPSSGDRAITATAAPPVSARPQVDTRVPSRGAPATTPVSTGPSPGAVMPGGRPLSGSGARAARPLSATRAKPATSVLAPAVAAPVASTAAVSKATRIAAAPAAAAKPAATTGVARIAAQPIKTASSSKALPVSAVKAAPAPTSTSARGRGETSDASKKPARGASAGPTAGRAASKPSATKAPMDPVQAAREAALRRFQADETARAAQAALAAPPLPAAPAFVSAASAAPSSARPSSAGVRPVSASAPASDATVSVAPLVAATSQPAVRPGSPAVPASSTTAVRPSSASASHHASLPTTAASPLQTAPLHAEPIVSARPTSGDASANENTTMDKSLVSRLRQKVEHERATAAPASASGPKSTRQRLAELAAAEGNAPAPVRRPAAPAPTPAEAPTLSSDMDPHTRDIMRNVDYLRVLAGEKSRLAADDDAAKPAFASFTGSGHRLGGGAAEDAHVHASTGEKRRIVVGGQVMIAKGHSDTPAEMAKRAAALRARMAEASPTE